MDRPLDQLGYESRPCDVQRLTLELMEGGCSLIFPLQPAWVVWAGIGFTLIPVTCGLIGGASMVWLFYIGTLPLSASTWWTILAVLGTCCMAGISCWRDIHSYQKYGHLARCIRVNRSTQTLSFRDERSSRWRDWPLASVQQVRLKPLKPIIPGQKAAELVIRMEKRWTPLRYRFRNEDVQVAEQFAAWLNEARPNA